MKCFHVGYVGLVGNLRFMEIFDFLTGWFGFDLCGDDGQPYGKWPWQSDYSGNIPMRPDLGY
jgi:hypothetical protein